MALIRSTDKLVEGSSNLFFSAQRAQDALSSTISSLSTQITNEVSARQSAISTEQSVRAAADSALSGRLDVIEGSGAGSIAKALSDAEAYADAKIAALVNGAPAMLDTLKEIADQLANDESVVGALTNTVAANLQTAKDYADTKVGVEKTRAEGAESALSGRISSLESDATTKAYVDGKVSMLEGEISQEVSDRQAAVSAEQTRAMGVESGLRSDLTSEVSRAQGVEGGLRTDLTSEVSRAQGIESGLRTDLNAEISRAQGVEGGLRTDLNSEISNRQSAVSAEQSARQSADSALSGRLDVIEGSGAGSVAKALVDAKAYSDQKVADLVNGAPAMLDTLKEIADQLASDESVVSALTNTVASNLQTAKDYADTKVAAEASARDSAVSSEQSARQSADSALSGRIAALEADPVTKSYVDTGLAGKVDVTPNYDIKPSVYGGGSKSANFTINLAQGAKQKFTLGASVTVTFSNPVSGADYLLELVQDGTGGRQITWPSVQWFNEVAPTLSGANKVDFVHLFYDGSSYYGSYQLADVVFATSSDLSSQIASEAATRAAADTTLQSNITAEASARSSADTTLQNNINSEASSRAAEDLTMVKLDGSRALTGQLVMNGGMSVQGGQVVKYSAKSANYTLTASDYMIGVTNTSSPKVMTLPSSPVLGMAFVIKDASGAASVTNYIQIVPQGGKTIDGQSDYKLVAPYESGSIVYDGTNWMVM